MHKDKTVGGRKQAIADFKKAITKSRREKDFHIGDVIKVKDRMQNSYKYELETPIGKEFHPNFHPELTPPEMLKLGVFEGKYLNDCTNEFPREWFENAINKLSPERPDPSKNHFGIKSRQSLQIWRQKDWIMQGDPDIRGWFQWYCRYYLGRRDKILDERQIKRWRAFKRHAGQIKKNCQHGDLNCRPKQRQALLQWAYDPFI